MLIVPGLSFFSAFPFLLYSNRHSKKINIRVGFSLLFITLIYGIFIAWGSSSFFFDLVFSIYIPLSLLALGLVWNFVTSIKSEMKLVVSLLPSLFFSLLLLVMLFLDRALLDTIYNSLKDAFVALLGSVMELLEIELSDAFFSTVLYMVVIIIFPLLEATGCVSLFISESVAHSKESEWEERVENFEYPTNFVWVFILSLFFFLLTHFVSMSVVVEIAIISFFISMVLIYAIEGFSVLFAWIRKRNQNFKSVVFFVLIFALSMVFPGISLIVLIVLPILGILENFFDLKKRTKK